MNLASVYVETPMPGRVSGWLSAGDHSRKPAASLSAKRSWAISSGRAGQIVLLFNCFQVSL